MTPVEQHIGQAMLTVMANAKPDTISIGYVCMGLKDQGITEVPGSRLIRFLKHLELIEHTPAVYPPDGRLNTPDLFRITLPGLKAQGMGLANFMAEQDAKEEAKHQAALASIRGQKWSRVGIIVAIAVGILNIIAGVLNYLRWMDGK